MGPYDSKGVRATACGPGKDTGTNTPPDEPDDPDVGTGAPPPTGPSEGEAPPPESDPPASEKSQADSGGMLIESKKANRDLRLHLGSLNQPSWRHKVDLGGGVSWTFSIVARAEHHRNQPQEFHVVLRGVRDDGLTRRFIVGGQPGHLYAIPAPHRRGKPGAKPTRKRK